MSKSGQSLTARISTRFRQAGKSLASSIGLTEHGPSTPLHTTLFHALDADHDGALTHADVREWLLDEQFIGNPYWDLTNHNANTVDELTARFTQRLTTHNTQPNTLSTHAPLATAAADSTAPITYADWTAYFQQKKEKEVVEMGRSVLHVTRDRQDKAIRKIFDAMDVNGQGDLDFDSVNAWLKYDAAYSAQQGMQSTVASEDERQALFDGLDRDHDGCVTFDDLAAYLRQWSIRDLRVRTSAMRQDAETRKMKRMAELLAATMASRLGLGNGGAESTDRHTLRAASVSGRPRSVSDMASGPPSSLNGSGSKVVEVGGGSGAAAGAGGKRAKAKGTKSNIQRQIDDLVLQSLALAAESSEINAKRRKLNVVNEKLDRELVRCERERLKLLTAIAEQDNEMAALQEQAGGTSQAAVLGINERLTAVNAVLDAKRDSVASLTNERNALAQSTVDLHNKQTEVEAKLASANDAIAPADAFIARTKETTANIERALDTVNPNLAASNEAAAQVDSDKARVERKVAELRAQMEQVEAQRAGLLRDQQALAADLQHTKEEEEARRQQVGSIDAQLSGLSQQLKQLETERAALESRAASGLTVVPAAGADVGRRLAEVSGEVARKREILGTMNSDRETMSVQLREMEQQHSALTRRHIEISTQLTNINQQISILFDGQLYERRNSFGDTASDGQAPDSLPVPCVASVECEMDGKKTTGLLNVSNYILMYESRIAHYQGRGLLGGGGGEGKSPPSASSPVLSSSSRRASLTVGVGSLSESTRFCVDISDVLSVKFIHTNDDDGHEEEGYEDEGLSELESSLKEPTLATIVIQLRAGYHNRFLSSDGAAGEEDGSHVITPPNSGGPSSLPRRSSTTTVSPHASTVVCYGDYDSLKRVDKSLRLFMQLLEAKVNHQAFRRRAASVQVSAGREQAYLEEKVNDYRRKRGVGSAVDMSVADITITGYSEITSQLNLKKILASSPAIATSPTASPTACESWRLAYSQSQHGSSFPYFFRVLADSQQSMVVLRSAGGRIFGGYCGVEWEDRIHQMSASASFYGNRDCFVWRLVEDKVVQGSALAAPAFGHASSEPTGAMADGEASLLLPSTAASSIVMDTMSKATHAVEVASAAGLDVAPAVRRASIDTTAMSLGGGALPLAGGGATGAEADAAQEALNEMPHVPSTLEVFPASGINTNFMFSSPDLIAMGGRSSALSAASTSAASTPTGFAWSIDRDFREGSSSECDTYKSPVLAEAVEWQCANVEVWVPASQIGYRSHAAAGQRSDEEEEAAGGLLTPPTINISVTPPTAASPPQVVSPR